MAVTKIKPIKSTLSKALDYIENPDKTDGKMLVSSFGCSYETADIEFEYTLSQALQKGNNLAFHLIQSFEPGEVDYQKAHEIGKQLADAVTKGQHEYVLTTHIDKGHVHNHIIFCAVNFVDHHKYNSNKRSYYGIRNMSDKLCRENGLSVVVPGKGSKGKSYAEYQAEKTGTSLTRPNLISLLGTLVVIFVSAISFLFGRAYIKTLKTFFDELSASISILSQGKPLPAAVGNLERVSEAKGLLTQFREMADHVVKSDLALREANANLERRVKQRTADLERRNRELSAINLLLSPIAQSPKDNDAPVFSMALERFGQAWDLDQIVIADGEHHCSSREVRQHYQTVTPLKDEKVLAVRSSYPMNPELQEALERFARFIDIVLDNKRLYIDISKQHAALTAALGGMAEGFVLFDKDAKVIFSNEKFRRFTSDSLQLNLDKSSREIFDFLNHLSPSSAAHESPSSAQNDVLELIDKDAKRRHFHLSRLTVHLCGYDHHVFDGLAVLVRDITNEYEVSRLKDDVIGLVAHELNNPVATIRIGLETLIKRNSHLSPALRLQITENMASDALRLQNLITEWLNISRLNSGVLSCKMERLDVVGLISQQIDEWEKQTEMTVQRLYKFSPLYTMGDAARLRQVLRNLLDNALKYNNKTRPKISVSVKTMNADIIVDVQDNGMGIAAEDLEKIFERFYRSERARQQTQQGSGLGLAICRAIVERFGGTLTIKDTALDIGSTFRVTLPILSEN